MLRSFCQKVREVTGRLILQLNMMWMLSLWRTNNGGKSFEVSGKKNKNQMAYHGNFGLLCLWLPGIMYDIVYYLLSKNANDSFKNTLWENPVMNTKLLCQTVSLLRWKAPTQSKQMIRHLPFQACLSWLKEPVGRAWISLQQEPFGKKHSLGVYGLSVSVHLQKRDFPTHRM